MINFLFTISDVAIFSAIVALSVALITGLWALKNKTTGKVPLFCGRGIVVAVVITALVFINFMIFQNYCRIPNVVDMTKSEAISRLSNCELEYEMAKGIGSEEIVTQQFPVANSIERKGIKVNLVFFSTDRRIPIPMLSNPLRNDSSYFNSDNYYVSVNYLSAFSNVVYGEIKIGQRENWEDVDNDRISIRGEMYQVTDAQNLIPAPDSVLFTSTDHEFFQFRASEDLSDGNYIGRVYVFFDQTLKVIDFGVGVTDAFFTPQYQITYSYIDGHLVEDDYTDLDADGHIPPLG